MSICQDLTRYITREPWNNKHTGTCMPLYIESIKVIALQEYIICVYSGGIRVGLYPHWSSSRERYATIRVDCKGSGAL